MEISFKWPSFYFCLLCFQLCNGNPITPNSTEIDSHTKLLTGIISLLLTVCGLVFIAACLCCQRRQSFEKFRNSPVIGYSISDIEHGHVNPIANGGEFTIFSPLSPPHFNNNVFHSNDEAKARIVEESADSCYDIKSWFSPTEKDFPRNRLKYIKELGSGWFGKVVQGAAQDKDEEQSWTSVVVRILEATSSQTEKTLFLQDAAIYRCSSHTNILSLVGRSLESVPFLLLQEYCPQGDLKRYLQSNKADAEKLLSTEYPLIWCCQLTSALKHIHENNIVHHDLASRNCQLTSNLTLKLGDYGLGPFRYPADYYQGLPVVPVRWCAPESLVCTQTTIQPKKITPEGNVWSLGVTMWEICECGEQPYRVLNDDEVISQVLVASSVTLERPAYSALYTDYIFRLMKSCWTSVESRPTVSQIDLMLTDLLQVHRNTTYNTLEIDEFDKRWESCKPNTIIKTDQITEALLMPERSINKSISPSLTNLHGSLDNLTNEPKNDSLTSQITSASDVSDFDTAGAKKQPLAQFKLTANPSFQRTGSSGSETEEENWRNKVERGAYTEKVRQKSRSVADLMVLTHVDYSESESETPLPSLDYRVNYKNVRLAGLEAPGNLEGASMIFGSEGNLLSVQDTFQEELKKLQEERRDSLPFVPDTVSQNSFSNKELSSSSKLMQELNSTVDIQPVSQIFNVYNVTIDNFNPIKLQKNALDEIKPDMSREMRIVDCKALLNDFKGSENCDNSEIDILRSGDSIKVDCEATKFGSDSATSCTNPILSDDDEAAEELRIAIAIVDEILEDAVAKIVSREKIDDEQVIIEVCDLNLLNTVKDEEDLDPEYVEINDDNKENDTYIKDEEKIIKDVEDTKANQEDIKDLQSVDQNGRIFKLETQNTKQVPKLSDLIIHSEHLKHLMDKQPEKNDTRSPIINFDLSLDQEEAKPNSLTHSTMFTSTPFRKREVSLPTEDKYSSLNLFSNEDTDLDKDSLSYTPLNYSLETWDNFLGTTLDNHEHPENNFDSFTSEPQSLIYIQEEKCVKETDGDNRNNRTQVLNTDGAAVDLNEQMDATYDLIKKNGDGLVLDGTYNVEKSSPNLIQDVGDGDPTCSKEEDPNVGGFENGGGWFLHPQPAQELSGNIEIQSPVTDSYIGFGIDDEIMSAIRNELLSKLPHAQGANADRVREEEEDWDVCERNEVFLRYNVYNTPLSPIPEESYLEDAEGSPTVSPKPEREQDDADWSGRTDTDTLTHDIESDSAHTLESPLRGQFNRHTPSQDSCCSNDTLFNLEELICVTTDLEKDVDLFDLESTYVKDNLKNDSVDRELDNFNKNDICEFLSNERNHSLDSDGLKSNTLNVNFQSDKQVAPLPSPEENPWKQLPASQLNFKAVTPMTQLSLEERVNVKSNDSSVKNDDIADKIEDSTVNKDIAVKIEDCTVTNVDSGVKNDDISAQNDDIAVKIEDSIVTNDNNVKIEDIAVNNYVVVKNDDVSAKNDDISAKNDDIAVKIEGIAVNNDIAVKIDDNSVKNDDNSVKNGDNCAKNDESIVKIEAGSISDKEVAKPVAEEDYDSDRSEEQNLTFTKVKPDVLNKMASVNSSLSLQEFEDVPVAVEPVYENTEAPEPVYENDRSDLYENSDVLDKTEVDLYDDYVNIVNKENDRNRSERDGVKDAYIDIYGHDGEAGSEDENIYGILTDIRFTGPTDNQMMSTSFSENNDEQGWESGSDSRSSSSGEFIWKEGEHEESLKALRAAPQDVLENIKPMEGIAEDAYEESDVSSSFSDDEETPEFVPSAWDKFAMPSKSALRSPEKTLNKHPEKKSKGVWFKEQKYHCIYEYPKEPESPIMPIQDLWKPQTDFKSFADWEFDGEVFDQARDDTTSYTNRTNSILCNQNLYHLTSITDLIPENCTSTNTNGEFFISSSAQPFHAHGISSQFFPGCSSNWTFENATPDSGVEDVTPGSEYATSPTAVPALKYLASEAVAKQKLSKPRNNEVMGGLRHTRNKLKLDLPPSPSAFTADKPFTIEPAAVEHAIRDKPTFTTFGKSRFLVQHVDTPPDERTAKNVSFEALPYQPLNPPLESFDSIERSLMKDEEDDECKLKVEVVRGEASLLDSGDEDSGIESASTLERKITNSQV